MRNYDLFFCVSFNPLIQQSYFYIVSIIDMVNYSLL